MIDVFVPGVPVPQGSAKAYVHGGRAVVTSDNARLRPWRSTVTAAIAAIEPDVETGPVEVTLDFTFARPASHFGKRGLRGTAPDFPAVRPDIDKLCRAVMDALSSVVWVDDRQVARLVASKRWPDEGEAPGASIRVRRLAETR